MSTTNPPDKPIPIQQHQQQQFQHQQHQQQKQQITDDQDLSDLVKRKTNAMNTIPEKIKSSSIIESKNEASDEDEDLFFEAQEFSPSRIAATTAEIPNTPPFPSSPSPPPISIHRPSTASVDLKANISPSSTYSGPNSASLPPVSPSMQQRVVRFLGSMKRRRTTADGQALSPSPSTISTSTTTTHTTIQNTTDTNKIFTRTSSSLFNAISRNRSGSRSEIKFNYVKVKTNNKQSKEFSRLLFVQGLSNIIPSPTTASTGAQDNVVSDNTSTTSLTDANLTTSPVSMTTSDDPFKQQPPSPIDDSSSVHQNIPPHRREREQSLTGTPKIDGPIWALRFSEDGKYLAAGGQDGVIRVWIVVGAAMGEKSSARKRPTSMASTGGMHPSVSNGSLSQLFDIGQNSETWSPNMGKSFRASTSFYGNADNGAGAGGSSPVFQNTPARIYKGHSADILDLAFSRNNFIVSASMDKTVRLWHILRKECLCVFQHQDFVTSVRFHPLDDRVFCSGSLDGKLRVWNVSEKKVKNWYELPDKEYITAVSFTADGTMIVVGTYSGDAIFLETEGLKYHTIVHVGKKSASDISPSRSGRKITGIEYQPLSSQQQQQQQQQAEVTSFLNPSIKLSSRLKGKMGANGNAGTGTGSGTHTPTMNTPMSSGAVSGNVLISSNDSRARLYDLRDKGVTKKFKGHKNKNMQIRATFSDDGRYVISGSEDKSIYIWNTADPAMNKQQSMAATGVLASMLWLKNEVSLLGGKGGEAYESAEVSDDVVTCAIMAPKRTRTWLERCGARVPSLNPAASTVDLSVPASEGLPTSTSNGSLSQQQTTSSSSVEHADGRIIVVADHKGRIRIYENESAHDVKYRVAAMSAANTHLHPAVSTSSLYSLFKSNNQQPSRSRSTTNLAQINESAANALPNDVVTSALAPFRTLSVADPPSSSSSRLSSAASSIHSVHLPLSSANFYPSPMHSKESSSATTSGALKSSMKKSAANYEDAIPEKNETTATDTDALDEEDEEWECPSCKSKVFSMTKAGKIKCTGCSARF